LPGEVTFSFCLLVASTSIELGGNFFLLLRGATSNCIESQERLTFIKEILQQNKVVKLGAKGILPHLVLHLQLPRLLASISLKQ
jgi:hypothetical protein